jgi:LAO/AO transport system kinase
MAIELPTLTEIQTGAKRALAHALACIETLAGTDELVRLLDAASAAPRAHVTGLTGPPGVGKSTLTRALAKGWRERGDTVGVLAVDPSSSRTGGALLGDRARIGSDPADAGLFVRSMAARNRLGGLSDQAFAAVALMRAAFDRLIVETVGVGQSESDIALVADTLILCVQPASGDSLQFMKAGLMELPDVILITKSDMGASARRALSDVQGALSLSPPQSGRNSAVVLQASASTGAGLADLIAALDGLQADEAGLRERREKQRRAWTRESLRAKFGSDGLAALEPLLLGACANEGPFAQESRLAALLRARLCGLPAS